VDLNGDKDTLDTVIMARSSVTKTQRPGVTAEINTTLGNHQVRAGVWFEQAQHVQTQPAVGVNASGEAYDIWLRDGQTLRPDGSTYQGRDWKTVSTAYQFYLSDNMSFGGDKGVLSLGVRAPQVKRDVTNYANEGFTTSYNIQKTYSDVLPQIGVRYNLDKQQQVFMNVGKNFRAAPNFAFTGSNVRLNAAGQVELVTEALPETSVMTDLGYRIQTRGYSLSATLFNSNFKDRQANAYDPVADRSTYTNAGRVKTTGLELEAGSAPFMGGFTAYASMTAQSSELLDNITVAKGQEIPTAGKQFTLVPDRMFGGSLQYTSGPFYARLKVKHTGRPSALPTIRARPLMPCSTPASASRARSTRRSTARWMCRSRISTASASRCRRPRKDAYDAYAASGMLSAAQDYDIGGMQLPYTVDAAANAFFAVASISISSSLLSVGNANLLMVHGTDLQKKVFALNEFSGRFSGTMCLSEPQAGSSLSDVATRAVPDEAPSVAATARCLGIKTRWARATASRATRCGFRRASTSCRRTSCTWCWPRFRGRTASWCRARAAFRCSSCPRSWWIPKAT
jgi:hypothetical protein